MWFARENEVYVVGVAGIPFVAIDVGVLPSKLKETAKRVIEVDIPRLEAESGLKIKAEYPFNKSSYSGIAARDLALVALEALFKNVPAIAPERVDVFRIGSVICHKTEEINMHAFAKVVALRAGMKRADSETKDKACSSALAAAGEAYRMIKNGDADFAVAGGIEKMCDVSDRLVRLGLTNPFDGRLMAALANEVAGEFNLTREELDDYAYGSCRRAKEWQGKHRFIAPVQTLNGTIIQFDERVERRAVDRKAFAKAQRYPQYADKEDSPKCDVVTWLNSAQYAGGGGFVFLASGKMVKKHNLSKLARILAFSVASGGEPKNFILKPEEAIQKCLDATGLHWNDIGHIEDNEAFSVGPVLLMLLHHIERERMNRGGGAISHGHAIGGTTGRLLVKDIDIMERDKEKYTVVTACNAVDEAPAMFLVNPYV